MFLIATIETAFDIEVGFGIMINLLKVSKP